MFSTISDASKILLNFYRIKIGGYRFPEYRTVKQELNAIKGKVPCMLGLKNSGFTKQFDWQQTYSNGMTDKQDGKKYSIPNRKNIFGNSTLKYANNQTRNNIASQFPVAQNFNLNRKIQNLRIIIFRKLKFPDRLQKLQQEKLNFIIELGKKVCQEQSDVKLFNHSPKKESDINIKNPAKEWRVTTSKNTKPLTSHALFHNDSICTPSKSVTPKTIKLFNQSEVILAGTDVFENKEMAGDKS